MRQIIGVLAVLLILSFVAWDDVEGRDNPYGYSDPYIDDVNEDHPWGGEDEVSDDLPSLVMPGTPGQGLSLVRPNIDIIWKFFITIWIDNSAKEDPINIEVNDPIVEDTYEGSVTNNN